MNEKTFHFSAPDAASVDRGSLTVTIEEDLDHVIDGYGCYAWISAPVLAHFVWRRKEDVRGRRVLEIGAGPALPGIVAGRCGVAALTLADSQVFHPDAVRLARRNADANGLPDANVIDVTWGMMGPEMASLARPDVVLASDCLYDTHDFENVIVTIATLLWKRESRDDDDDDDDDDDSMAAASPPLPEPELWMSYQERSSGRSIRNLLKKYQLRCVEEISWREFYESASTEEKQTMNQLNDHHQIDSVWILVIKRKSFS